MPRLICFAIALLAAAPASAAPLTRVNVDLWPEYDRSAMLVMIELELPASAKLPAVVPVQIPTAVGEPHAVATRGSDGRPYKAPYKRSVEGEWATVSITTDSRNFRLEYYAPLVTKAAARSYHFEWPSPPKIDAVQFRVQVPRTGKNLSTQPKTTHSRTGRRGLTYQRLDAGAHAAGQPLRFDLTYENESGKLSAKPQPPRSPTPASGQMVAPQSSPRARTTAPQPTQDDPFMRWLLIGLVIAGVAFVFVMARSGSDETQSSQKTRTKKST